MCFQSRRLPGVALVGRGGKMAGILIQVSPVFHCCSSTRWFSDAPCIHANVLLHYLRYACSPRPCKLTLLRLVTSIHLPFIIAQTSCWSITENCKFWFPCLHLINATLMSVSSPWMDLRLTLCGTFPGLCITP